VFPSFTKQLQHKQFNIEITNWKVVPATLLQYPTNQWVANCHAVNKFAKLCQPTDLCNCNTLTNSFYITACDMLGQQISIHLCFRKFKPLFSDRLYLHYLIHSFVSQRTLSQKSEINLYRYKTVKLPNAL